MIKSIKFTQYRRLKAPLELEFCNHINIISGLNGTCKSSILYLISNAFQAEKSTNTRLEPASELNVINNISAQVNAKIELLTKGDKEYNDPAPGQRGELFSVQYNDDQSIRFRRHNKSSDDAHSRFRLIPQYSSSQSQSLPTLRTVYLSLARLLPFGEMKNDTPIKGVRKELPEEYNTIFHQLVERITGIKITESAPQIIENIKTRTEYSTDTQGIDSNTASVGEDNAIIILKNLVLLRYYYEHAPSLHSLDQPASILLIDEMDATLHPAMQLRLLNTLKEYSESYKIQVFFTTHSLYLIEKALNQTYQKHIKLNYLTHQGDHVSLLPDPSIHKIERHLQEIQTISYSLSPKIPVFTEDSEARVILNAIFGYFSSRCKYFKKIKNNFHFVNASIGCKVLNEIFRDQYLNQNTMNAICVLDGDNNGQKAIKHNIIVLPGGKNPEQLIFDYYDELANEPKFEMYHAQNFWDTDTALNHGLTKHRYLTLIKPQILAIEEKLNHLRENEKSISGVKREENKKIFKNNLEEFKIVLDFWLDNHWVEMEKFYKELRLCFRQVALLHKLDLELWPQTANLSQARLSDDY
ncbi:ATP-binding protein [Neisseria weixii]|uniref:ATP-binding protein n=1 Tax=Neisseria weixii TaxID=1853276 RepID=A0A3N4MTP3_9NEIS|nr:AAA family ATPase [Neisseria weixii]RPD87282.1 ATP-binding protein [Neisseria weixii]RPD88940.1 ATP-binding protein [Neisseria weixii]